MTTLALRRRQMAAASTAVAAALAMALASPLAAAQDADKSVVAEPVAVAPAFSQWVDSLPSPPPPAPTASATALPWPSAPANGTLMMFEPAAVILGLPDLPLLVASRAAVRAWSQQFNYQGAQFKLLTLDPAGRSLAVRNLASPPKPGERFKVRVTASFDGVADLSLVLGDAWTSQRAGQFYPSPGLSVRIKAGESVDLPLDANQYFMMGNNPEERLLLSVRHSSALGEARSPQPAYRQDTRAGSTYLQLVPGGTYPAIEQLLTAAAR